MHPHSKDPLPDDKNPEPPRDDTLNKEVQREQAEVKEVAGRHKNDGALNHKGRS